MAVDNMLWMAGSIESQLLADEAERQAAYRAAWDAYKGNFPPPLEVKAGQPNDNVLASKCRVIVDASVAYLFGADIGFDLDQRAGDKTAQEQWLSACWAANRKMTTLLKLGTNGAVCGHTFARILYPYPATAPYPRLIILDPANVTVKWDMDDIDAVTRYRIQWNSVNATTGKAEVRRQDITRQDNGYWLVEDFRTRPGSAAWERTSSELWRWTWPPIVDCQNIPVPNEYYGEADISPDVIALNKARNLALSFWARIIKYQAHQRLWGRGFRDDQVSLGPDNIFIIESEAGTLATIDPPSNLAGLSEYDRRVEEALHEVSRTPAIATGKLENTGQLSGVALQILYGPLMQKVEAKRRTYGDMLVELNRRLLALAGYGEENLVSITWPEAMPQDVMAERQALQIDTALGVVSKATAAQKLGYNWEQEQEQMAAEMTPTEEADGGGIPNDDEGKRLLVAFQAVKEAVDAGLPLDVVLMKYLAWTQADVNAMNETQAAQQPDPAEVAARTAMMQAGQQQQDMMNGQTNQAPQATRQGADGGAAAQGG